MANKQLELKDFEFPELFETAGLERLDNRFLKQLKEYDVALHQRLIGYRQSSEPVSALATSELLLLVAPYLEGFIASVVWH